MSVPSASSDDDDDDRPLIVDLLPQAIASGALPAATMKAARSEQPRKATKQRTLFEFASAGAAATSTDALAAELAKPVAPRKAVPRPLSDKTTLKLAQQQFEFEGGLAPSSAAARQFVQSATNGFTKAQMKTFQHLVFEFMGERPKADLARRGKLRVQSEKTAAAAAAGIETAAGKASDETAEAAAETA